MPNDATRQTREAAGGAAPGILVHVPGPLRKECGGAAEVRLNGSSVGALLVEMERRQPALFRNICDETGAVRRHINIFVNIVNIRDGAGLETRLAPGDSVTILPAVSGG